MTPKEHASLALSRTYLGDQMAKVADPKAIDGEYPMRILCAQVLLRVPMTIDIFYSLGEAIARVVDHAQIDFDGHSLLPPHLRTAAVALHEFYKFYKTQTPKTEAG